MSYLRTRLRQSIFPVKGNPEKASVMFCFELLCHIRDVETETHFLRKTTAREALFPPSSSVLSLPLSTVSEPQSSTSSSSSSLEEDSSCLEGEEPLLVISPVQEFQSAPGFLGFLSVIHSCRC